MTGDAPFRGDLAEGPADGHAFWTRAADGVRIRVAVWPRGDARGTAVIFPGRSEYVEKYGRTAAELQARGYAVTAVDWRGQGMADRLLDDPMLGHVGRFQDYQMDVDAALALLETRGLPQPFFLLGHSMGGCIGLRTLLDRGGFAAAAFSAPMWGISISPKLKLAAKTLPKIAIWMGFGSGYTPTTRAASYMIGTQFEDNVLTTDRDMWDYMVRQAEAEAQFRMGGPSIAWLAEALAETRRLAARPRPRLPAHASVGSEEKIVDPAAVGRIMADWPGSSFAEVEGAEHELLMETPAIRGAFLDRATACFEAAAREPA